LGEYGFCASGIDYITLPDSLAEIREYAFSSCTDLTNIHIPDNVLQIGRYAFAEDWNLYSVTFNETARLPRIGFAAFAYTGLQSFTVPASVSTIAQEAFVGSRSLSAITFAENSKLESISAYMFDGCENLQTITFLPGSKLTSIQAHGLEGMDKLSYVDFGDAKPENVDNFAFRFCESLTSLSLPDSVKSVGRYAFYGCKSLSDLALPEGVEHIGSYAFLGTNDLDLYMKAETMPAYLDENWDYGIRGYYTGVSAVETAGDFRYAVLGSGNLAILEYLGTEKTVDLTTVNLGAPITTIGGGAFKDSTAEKVILPETLTTIQAEAFQYAALREIAIPASVTFIGREAFAYSELQSLTFEKGAAVSVIEQYAFRGTEKLTSVKLPASLTALGTGVFMESGLTSLTFAEGFALTEIPKNAFMGTKLVSVVLPDSVVNVGHNAFRDILTLKSVTFGNNAGLKLQSNVFYNTGLESLHIPANVTYIGEYCFVGLENLTAITVDGNNPNFKAVDGLLLSKDGRKLVTVPAGRTGSLTVPISVEEIGFGAFENTALEEVLFDPNANILTFGYRAFFRAKNLTVIHVPASVVSIDYYAFAYCEKLHTVNFAKGNCLKGIYEGAFCGDINLENIVIPDAIVEISDFAFYGCAKITSLPLGESNAVKGIYDYAFAYTSIGGEFTAPETLIDIGAYAFLGTDITKLTIPDTNKKELIIGIGAFEDCNKLTEVTLPFIGASYEDEEISWFGYIFGAGAYEANETYVPESLKTVTITEGITAVYTGGFAYCLGLETINMPHSVSVLHENAFAETTAKYELTNVITAYWYDTFQKKVVVKPYKGHFGSGIQGRLELSKETTSIGYYAFENVHNITELILPNSLTTLELCAFAGSGFETLEIPDSVTTMDYGVFGGCSNLYKVSLPKGLTSIEKGTFRLCHNLAIVEIPEGVTYIGAEAFDGCYKLQNIVIPDNVITIEEKAFSWSGLSMITLGANLKNIESYAFEFSDLRTIYNYSTLDLQLGSDSYGGIAVNANLIVDRDGNKNYVDTGIEYIETSDQFLFTKDSDNTYTLCAYKGLSETIALPKDINGNPYKIDRFIGGVNVVIPEGRVRIDEYAFYENKSIKSVTLPNSVTEIGVMAFSQCSNLKSIKMSERVKTIEVYAFANCSSLSEIEIPEGVQQISCGVFEGCDNLGSVSLPNTVSTIETRAFVQCPKLAKIDIPESVCDIGENAFSKNTDVAFVGSNTAYRMLDGILYDADFKKIIFVSDKIPENLSLPNGITQIPDSAFSENVKLRSIVIPEGVTRIGSNAFSNCIHLTSVSLPDSLTQISGAAFRNCSSLLNIALPNNLSVIYDHAFLGCSSLTSINIPYGITTIPIEAFSGCSSLKHIELPSSVERIEGYAFRFCGSLTEITIPDRVTAIGAWAFSQCENLSTVTLPEGLTAIDYGAFMYCYKLKSITIPDTVTSIGESAFPQSTKLEVSSSNNAFVWKDGILYDKELTRIVYVSDEIPGNVILPEGITTIPAHMFTGSNKLISITIPDSVTRIETQAFMDCQNLRTVYIGKNVTDVGESIFSGCCNLTQVTLPENLKALSWSMFFGCSGLTKITIPENVVAINTNAFNGCVNLFEVVNNSSLTIIPGSEAAGYVGYYSKVVTDANGNKIWLDENSKSTYVDTAEGFRFIYEKDRYTLIAYIGELDAVELPTSINGVTYSIHNFCGVKEVIIPNEITSIPTFGTESGVQRITVAADHPTFSSYDGVLYSKDGTRIIYVPARIQGSVSIPFGVTYIGHSSFKNRTGLTSIVIPGSVTYIDEKAFSGCNNLTSITLPDNIRSIGEGAFENCSNLESINLPESLESLGLSPFFGCTKLFNNPKYQCSQGIIIDGWLIELSENCEYMSKIDGIRGVCYSAYQGCNMLKQAIWHHLNDLPTNVETLFIYKIDEFTSGLYNLPLTLKSVVICDTVSPSDLRHCQTLFTSENITGITIYVEALEQDLRWDDNFPGWSNGNKVVYGDEWSWVTFYDGEGNVISREPKLNSEIIRLPVYEPEGEEGFSYVVKGWDLDGDWIADHIPATTAVDLEVRPIVEKVQKLYTVTFGDLNGKVYHTATLPYGSLVVLPEAPEKKGHDFLGWSNHYEGMTVTGDVTIYASWKHHGDGHVYGEAVWVAPTCEEKGFYKHTCTVCDEYYGTDHVEALGHSDTSVTVQPTCTEEGYVLHTCGTCGREVRTDVTPAKGHAFGEWTADIPASCKKEGLKVRSCGECGLEETEVIPAAGHRYTPKVVKEPTCDQEGTALYTCEECGRQVRESIPKTAHKYEKKYVAKSWLRILIEKLLDLLFGYEGDRAYYFVCSECGRFRRVDEVQGNGTGVQSVGCAHVLSDWELYLPGEQGEDSVEARYCTVCKKPVEFRTAEPCAQHGGEWVVAKEATCSEDGLKQEVCIHCGVVLQEEVIPAAGHDWSDWTDGAPGREERTCRVCGEVESREKAVDYDVDGDGAVTEGDAQLLLSILVGNTESEALFDFDFDGVLTIYDCVLLMQQIG